MVGVATRPLFFFLDLHGRTLNYHTVDENNKLGEGSRFGEYCCEA